MSDMPNRVVFDRPRSIAVYVLSLPVPQVFHGVTVIVNASAYGSGTPLVLMGHNEEPIAILTGDAVRGWWKADALPVRKVG